jgi:hypothetical protein
VLVLLWLLLQFCVSSIDPIDRGSRRAYKIIYYKAEDALVLLTRLIGDRDDRAARGDPEQV